MPAYNAEAYISEAIESVLAQEYSEWELIVVDDGSSDATSEIIQGYDDERIIYKYQENQGQTVALNQGMELARGNYITTLDADDWYTPNSIGDRATYLDNNPEFGVVYGDGNYCNEIGESFLRFTEHMPAGITGDVYDVLIVSPFYGTGATIMQRKSILIHNKIQYDEAIVWCQDWDFYIRLAEVANFGFIDSNTIHYRIHSDGMTMAMPSGRRLDSQLRMRNKVLHSQRFETVSSVQKGQFFYDFLVKDLKGRVERQDEIFDSTQFLSLSNIQQSNLMRVTATEYILTSEHTDKAIKWLREAWLRTPYDLKTGIIVVLAMINIDVTRKVINAWQGRRKKGKIVSPFELALSIKQDSN